MHLLSLDNHQLLVLWVELAVLLVTATSLGALARRLGQPAVIGELLAGLLLGPSVFGHGWRAGFRWFLPAGGDSQGLAVVASISLLVLLVVIGAESDLALIRRLGRAAAWVSTGSLVLPLAAGFGLALLLPAALLGPRDHRSVFALLVAGAIGVSSLPVIARTMSDLEGPCPGWSGRVRGLPSGAGRQSPVDRGQRQCWPEASAASTLAAGTGPRKVAITWEHRSSTTRVGMPTRANAAATRPSGSRALG
jgi:hypothetical protein